MKGAKIKRMIQTKIDKIKGQEIENQKINMKRIQVKRIKIKILKLEKESFKLIKSLKSVLKIIFFRVLIIIIVKLKNKCHCKMTLT